MTYPLKYYRRFRGHLDSSRLHEVGGNKHVTRDTTGALKLWLLQHRKHPYPNKPEKIMLAILSRMTLTQVSTWFANARRRLKKEYAGMDAIFVQHAESLREPDPCKNLLHVREHLEREHAWEVYRATP